MLPKSKLDKELCFWYRNVCCLGWRCYTFQQYVYCYIVAGVFCNCHNHAMLSDQLLLFEVRGNLS